MGVFVHIVATLFSPEFYPESVLPSGVLIVMALGMGIAIYRRGWDLRPLTTIGCIALLLFVGAGTYTAPSHRQTVAIALGLLAGALAGLDIRVAITTSDAGATVGLVVRILGAAIAVFVVPQVLRDTDAETTS